MRYSSFEEKVGSKEIPSFIFLKVFGRRQLLHFREFNDILKKSSAESGIYFLNNKKSMEYDDSEYAEDKVIDELYRDVDSGEKNKYDNITRERINESGLDDTKWIEAMIEMWIIGVEEKTENSMFEIRKEKNGGNIHIKILPSKASLYKKLFGRKIIDILIKSCKCSITDDGDIENRSQIISFDKTELTVSHSSSGTLQLFIDPIKDEMRGGMLTPELKRDFFG